MDLDKDNEVVKKIIISKQDIEDSLKIYLDHTRVKHNTIEISKDKILRTR